MQVIKNTRCMILSTKTKGKASGNGEHCDKCGKQTLNKFFRNLQLIQCCKEREDKQRPLCNPREKIRVCQFRRLNRTMHNLGNKIRQKRTDKEDGCCDDNI